MSKNMAEDIDNKVTQLRKGILELAIMAALYHETHYGYSLVRNLAGPGSVELKEGTIYPILARLAREGLVHLRVDGVQPGAAAQVLLADGQRPFQLRIAAERIPQPGAAGRKGRQPASTRKERENQ